MLKKFTTAIITFTECLAPCSSIYKNRSAGLNEKAPIKAFFIFNFAHKN